MVSNSTTIKKRLLIIRFDYDIRSINHNHSVSFEGSSITRDGEKCCVDCRNLRSWNFCHCVMCIASWIDGVACSGLGTLKTEIVLLKRYYFYVKNNVLDEDH